MRRLLIITGLILIFNMINLAQEIEHTRPIVPFDTAACQAEAKKNGMPDGELPGYLRFKAALYYAKYNNSLLKSEAKINMDKAALPDSSACYNMNFETQTFATWAADTGFLNLNDSTPIFQSGFSSNGLNASVMDPLARQTIFNIKPKDSEIPKFPYIGYDNRLTNSGFVDKVLPIDSDITVVAPNSNFSVRLGNALAGGQTESLKKTFVVDANSKAFLYSYAAVLENPLSMYYHTPAQRPSFTVRVLDNNGELLPGQCSYYTVYSGKDSSYVSLNDTVCKDFHLDPTGGCTATQFNYKNWTTVGIDLTAYMGQKITIEFTTRDCSLGGHFGYAYINAQCSSFEITSKFCPEQENDTLIAPSGYLNYTWMDPDGNVIGHGQEVVLRNPKLNDIYTVSFTSVTGCSSFLKTQIVLNPPAIIKDFELKTNVFTPNGDGKNDVFETKQFQYLHGFHIEIYNRWGSRVFESSDATNEWDGKVNNSPVDEGVYFWVIKHELTCDASHQVIISKGFVHLIR